VCGVKSFGKNCDSNQVEYFLKVTRVESLKIVNRVIDSAGFSTGALGALGRHGAVLQGSRAEAFTE